MLEREEGKLAIAARRGGTASEVATFLRDIEGAYNALYRLEYYASALDGPWIVGPGRYYLRSSAALILSGEGSDDFEILPRYSLFVSRISINSPGFWEFVGSLNPLQQIREYLKDRHERNKDRDYRNQSERERLELENEILKATLVEKETGILRERLAIMREVGFSDDQIQELCWRKLGPPLAALGRHQDSGLIEGPASDTSPKDT